MEWMSARAGPGVTRPRAPCWNAPTRCRRSPRPVEAARGGDGRVVVVAGRAGIGKSSLLAEGQRAARAAGFTVLTARASDLEREFAFGVARQLFERAVQRAPQWWAGAAEQARAVFDDVPAATGGIFEDVSQSVLHGLYWLVVNASCGWTAAVVGRRPAVVRPLVAALPVLPQPAARRVAGGRPGRAPDRRTAGWRCHPRRDRRGPGDRGGGTAAADGRCGGRGAAPADGGRARPTRSPRIAAAPPAAIRCCWTSWRAPCRPTASGRTPLRSR